MNRTRNYWATRGLAYAFMGAVLFAAHASRSEAAKDDTQSCPSLKISELDTRMDGAKRAVFPSTFLEPFERLWSQEGGRSLPQRPDHVVLYHRKDSSEMLVAYAKGDCLVALLPVPVRKLSRALENFAPTASLNVEGNEFSPA